MPSQIAKSGLNSTPCRNMTDLAACLQAPSHAVPTVEFTVYNFELPLNQADVNFFNQGEINIFAQRQTVTTPNGQPSISSSRNLTDQTLTFDVPFVLMGLCVYAYSDPVSTTVPGNTFGPRAAVTNGIASPDNMYSDQAFVDALAGPPIPPGTINLFSSAALDWGGPAWRFIWAFMHAYRLVMRCPTSSYEILMDEALADIGNCCGQTQFEGFGNSSIDHNYLVQRTNDRLASLAYPIAGWADPGVFFPQNVHVGTNAAHTAFVIDPQKLMPQQASYGRPFSTPTVEQWYRLPCPIPFPAVPQPKLKISLVQEAGDQSYLQRMLQEATGALNQVITGLPDDTFPVTPVGPSARGITRNQKIPGGQLRIGIGLKGFEVRESVCERLADLYTGQSMQEAMAGVSGLVCGPTDRISMPVGSIGDPNAR